MLLRDFPLPVTDPVLIVAIAMTIFLIAPLLAERVRVPGLIGILVCGAVVGPNGLNLLARSNTIILLGTVGLLYLMFMAGIEIDLLGFKRYRNRSIGFGIATFLLPQLVGTGVGLLLDYDILASILLGSMLASHTLLAYPIAIRYGIAKNQAVTTTVGGTIIAVTVAILVLAIVAASLDGALDALFWLRLIALLTGYVLLIWMGLPRLGRWFFRNERAGAGAEFVFVLATLFAGAYLADLAGIEPIVGAMFVGLALNRLIPDNSLLNNRIRFVGEYIFIPFFLLSIGMLVDVRVLAGGARAWEVMFAMTLAVVTTKWLAAWLVEKRFGFSRSEGLTIFGLTVPQGAGTLAVTLVGLEIGLFDDAIVNGAVLMTLVTCVIGPWLVEKHGRSVALHEQQRPFDPDLTPQRILVPMSKPSTARDLMDLALIIRDPDSNEPIYPITVFPADEERSSELVTSAEKMLSHAVAYAAGADVPVVPLTRMDYNYASGIARGIAETRTTTVIVGWDGRRSKRRTMFGGVLDQLLDLTKQQVLVAKLGHPLNTTERLVLLIPQGSDHAPGYSAAVQVIKLIGSRLGAAIKAYTVGGPADLYREQIESVRPEVPTAVEYTNGWPEALERIKGELRPNDLVIVIAARRGTIAWNDALERLPSALATLGPESFLMLYPAETAPFGRAAPRSSSLPRALSPSRVLFDIPRKPYTEAIRDLLESEFDEDSDLLQPVYSRLLASAEAFAGEIREGVVLVHARITDLPHPYLFLGISQEGVVFPHAAEPARAIFVLITSEDEPDEHLAHIAEISAFVSDSDRLAELLGTRNLEGLMRVAPTRWAD